LREASTLTRLGREALRPVLLRGVLLCLGLGGAAGAVGEPLTLHTRGRVPAVDDTNRFEVVGGTVAWEPRGTAIVVCDMWDKHWCPDATERVGEMVPRMNEVLKAARRRGVLILHCPSDTLDFYKDHPGRKRAQSAPRVETRVPLQGWCSLAQNREAALPIDDSDGGCDGCPECASHRAWTRQHPGLEIAEGDAITDSAEAYYLMRQRGVTNVIVMGVHANMCVLGRPFSIRQMVAQGQNVVLMRDLTDSMYNHRRKPYVSHFRGTELVVEHIEKYWCASITSSDFVGGEPFRFKGDVPKRLVFLIGEDEYDTRTTVPEFARRELEPRGLVTTIIHSSNEDKNRFPGIEALKSADLMFISIRRRALPKEQLDLVRAHVAAGKPVVGIRTASHAFDPQPSPSPDRAWPAFDDEILGADYQGHYGKGPATIVTYIPETAGNPILNGVAPEFRVTSHLYKYRKVFSTVTPLLRGHTDDGRSPLEPVAWINTADNRRVFYTSMGSPEDFQDSNFRRLLLNGILWSLDLPIPPADPVPLDYAADWHPLAVPGTWDERSQGRLAAFDGIAWYRCWVTVPPDWAGRAAELSVESVDDAHEAYVNGARVGGAGTFPPNYASGLSTPRRYALAPGSLRADAPNLVAIRVYDHGGRGGFKGSAPVLRSGDKAIRLAGDWEFRTGDQPAWAAPAQNPPPARARFSQVTEASSAAAADKPPEQLQPLPPEEAAQRFHVFDDLEWEQVLAEPVVAQPVFLNFDERGRMWVVQYRQYPHPAGLRMVSRDNVWRAVYDKVPQPPPHGVRGADKITLHEDTDGDGKFDRHKTFVDGLNIATSVCRGRGGVWVLNPPYLLFYPDANDDDVPDGDPVVHLAGFGLEDTHSVVNSLRWGPDGWLYAAQGSTVTANILRPGLDKEPIAHTMGQQIWRYHPETRRFEVFSEGGGNAFGCEIDEAGRIFSGHNGGNTRGFHYMQGAYLQKGFEKHGPLSNPYAFGYFPAMLHNDADRFTHNFIVYAGGALPESYTGRLFGVEPLQGRVVLSEVSATGSTFRTRDLGYPVRSDDKWFRPVDIKTGPDGAIYVCDWYDRQVNHYRNHEGQIDATNGRIYRLKRRGAKPGERFDLRRSSSLELMALLRHPNKWFRQTALQMLAERRDGALVPALEKQVDSETGPLALESLWAVNLCGGLDAGRAARWLTHPNPQVRLWTVRLLADANSVPEPLRDPLRQLAGAEPNVEVRAQIACSLRRLPASQGFPVLRALLDHDEDARDPRLPLLLWWVIEDKAESDREAVLHLFGDSPLWHRPLVEEHLLERLMRRYAQAGGRKNLLTAARLLDLAPDEAHSRRLMAGFEEAFKGRALAGLPQELLAAMSRHNAGSTALGLRQLRPEAVQTALKTIADPRSPEARRLELLGVLADVKVPESVPVLVHLLQESSEKQGVLRRAALAALQPQDDPAIAGQVLAVHPRLDRESQGAAQNLLASRPPWLQAFLKAVQAGTVPRDSVSPALVRRIRQQKDPALAQVATQIWGPAGAPTTAEMDRKIHQLAAHIQGGKGDPYTGRELFTATCAGCHRLFGRGGEVGPDLTTYKRDDLEVMLLNIVNPSAEIREGFENYLVETKDDRSLNGFLVEQDAQVVVLRGIDGQTTSLDRAAISEMRVAGSSLMPEGLLDPMTGQQVRDLFAYLRSTQPLVGERPGR
jgi:putative heme-binding domain-containing protein